jgi:alpha-1,2-mannosyltransferase
LIDEVHRDTESPRRSRIDRALPWVLALAGLVGLVSWIQRSGDFVVYVLVGNLALRGQDIYAGSNGLNTWPPFFSFLCVPLALLARLSLYLARGVWLVANVGLLWWTMKAMARLILATPLYIRSHPGSSSLLSPEILIPLLLCSRFVLSNFDHLQVNIIIFALTVAGIAWQATGREVRGGIAIGTAAALKVMPVLFVAYFVYRRRPRVALAAIGSGAVLSLLPALVYGPGRFVEYIGEWRAAVGAGWGVGKMNQSTFAMVDRFVGHGIGPLNARAISKLPESGHPATSIVYAALICAIVGLMLWRFRGPLTPASPAAMAEYGAVLIASAVLGPVTWKAYLVVLLFPCMLLVHAARDAQLPPRAAVILHRLLIAFFVGSVLAGVLGGQVAAALEMLSVATTATLLLFGTLVWIHPQLSRQ